MWGWLAVAPLVVAAQLTTAHTALQAGVLAEAGLVHILAVCIGCCPLRCPQPPSPQSRQPTGSKRPKCERMTCNPTELRSPEKLEGGPTHASSKRSIRRLLGQEPRSHSHEPASCDPACSTSRVPSPHWLSSCPPVSRTVVDVVSGQQGGATHSYYLAPWLEARGPLHGSARSPASRRTRST